MMRILLTFILAIVASTAWSQQFEIDDLSNKTYQEAGQLASGEIQVINFSNATVKVQCSIDKKSWVPKSIVNKSGMDVHLTSDVEFFYVRLCNTPSESNIICDTYRLSPGFRYVFNRSSNSEKIVLKKNSD